MVALIGARRSRNPRLTERLALAGLAAAGLAGAFYALRVAFRPRPFQPAAVPRDGGTVSSGDHLTARAATANLHLPAALEFPALTKSPERSPTGPAQGLTAAGLHAVALRSPATSEPAVSPRPSPAPPGRLRALLGWASYLVVIIGAIWLGPRVLALVLDTQHPLATVSSGSMWPEIKEGDVVLLEGVDGIDGLHVGDVIAFRHDGGLAIHRIVRIDGEQLTTRGDANTREDNPISFDDVIGRAVEVQGRLVRVPYLGYLAKLLGPIVGTSTDDPGSPGAGITRRP